MHLNPQKSYRTWETSHIIKKIHFPGKLCKVRKNVKKQNLSSQKDRIMKNVIINENKIFPVKLWKIRKNMRSKIVQIKNIYKFSLDHFLVKSVGFGLITKNNITKIKRRIWPRSGCIFLIILYSKNIQKKNSYRNIFSPWIENFCLKFFHENWITFFFT